MILDNGSTLWKAKVESRDLEAKLFQAEFRKSLVKNYDNLSPSIQVAIDQNGKEELWVKRTKRKR